MSFYTGSVCVLVLKTLVIVECYMQTEIKYGRFSVISNNTDSICLIYIQQGRK
jgi:hypothetical protein